MENTNSEKEFNLQNAQGNNFFVRSIMPMQGNPLGIVQVIHGMAEHNGRYKEFGEFLAQHGFGLVAADHPGHGRTAENPEALGHLERNSGWETMLSNAQVLYTHIRTTYSDVPVFVLGHSMGSILAKHFTAFYPVYTQGLILSGTFQMPKSKMHFLNAFVWLQGIFMGFKKKSRFFNKKFYESFNKHFKPGASGCEWITSDSAEMVEYAHDPFCGFDCSIGFYSNLGRGILAEKKLSTKLTYRKTLPILIFSGQDDPVGNFGKDPLAIHGEFFKQKFQNLTVKIFQGRHEMLHEKNKQKVFAYILNWMMNHLHVR